MPPLRGRPSLRARYGAAMETDVMKEASGRSRGNSGKNTAPRVAKSPRRELSPKRLPKLPRRQDMLPNRRQPTQAGNRTCHQTGAGAAAGTAAGVAAASARIVRTGKARRPARNRFSKSLFRLDSPPKFMPPPLAVELPASTALPNRPSVPRIVRRLRSPSYCLASRCPGTVESRRRSPKGPRPSASNRRHKAGSSHPR